MGPDMVHALDAKLPYMMALLRSRNFLTTPKNPASIHDNWRMSKTIAHALGLKSQSDSPLEYLQRYRQRGSHRGRKTIPKELPSRKINC